MCRFFESIPFKNNEGSARGLHLLVLFGTETFSEGKSFLKFRKGSLS